MEWNSETNWRVCVVLLSISSTFYKQIWRWYSLAKKLLIKTVIREKPRKTLSYQKGAHEMLMKLTPIVFIIKSKPDV